METVRSFVAIELDEGIKEGLSKVQSLLKAKIATGEIRWVAPSAIHLTLKFLGNVSKEMLVPITAALRDACKGVSYFELTFQGLGCFPSVNNPRVLWVGVKGDLDVLQKLQGAADSNLKPLGFKPEERSFSPHLTVGRVTDRAKPGARRIIGGIVSTTEVEDLGRMEVKQISLMRSTLLPTGAVYDRLEALSLEG